MKTYDDTRDVAIRIVDRLVDLGIIKDCTDTDDETELQVQDIIQEELTWELQLEE